jgi:tRNA pseudouridine38-40 synthase
MRIALGVSYRGQAYHGWQSQPHGSTVQDRLEAALSEFTGTRVATICAGRTDAGVHAVNQVVHFDCQVSREPVSWVRATNRYLPPDISVQWCRPVDASFHCRALALGRRYAYVLLDSPVRPALEAGLVGWSFRPLDGDAMRAAAQCLVGERDFSAFRAAGCQAMSPVKRMHSVAIGRRGAYWRFDFDATAFLHHMVRNIVGCLVAVGCGNRPINWVADVLVSRNRSNAAPTFAPQGLYFLGPYYDAVYRIPNRTPAIDWLP